MNLALIGPAYVQQVAVTQALELANAQDIHSCGGYAQYLLRRRCRAIHSSIREEERSMALHGWVRTIYFLAELVSPLLLNSSRGTRDWHGPWHGAREVGAVEVGFGCCF